ncbi:TPA: AraC family ligand binding domain-containing protein [Enterococcus faecium]
MNSKNLDKLLRIETLQEKEQKIKGQVVNDLEVPFEKQEIPKVGRNILFNDQDVCVRKHHRYAKVETHTHDFIEINYVYSGHCQQVIMGEKVSLSRGDLIILDKDTPHSISETNEDDIVINIMIKSEDIMKEIINKLRFSDSFLSNFLLTESVKYFV